MKLTLTLKAVEDKLTTSLRKLPGFKYFSFSVKEKSSKNNNGKAEEANAIGVEDYSFMLSGPHCATIFGFLENVVGFTKKSNIHLYTAWGLWQKIRRWLYLTNDELAKKTSEEFLTFRDQLNEFGNELSTLRSGSNCVSDYIHIAVNHLFTIIATIGSLVPLSNQGVESSHELDRFIMARSTSRGKMMVGTKKRKVNTTTFQVERTSQPISHELSSAAEGFSYDSLVHATERDWNDLYVLCQIMMKRYRILYLSFKYEDVTFKRLELRKGKVISQFWTRNLSNLLQPPCFKNEEGELLYYHHLAQPQCVDSLETGNMVDACQTMEDMSQRRPLADCDLDTLSYDPQSNNSQPTDDAFLLPEDVPNGDIVKQVVNDEYDDIFANDDYDYGDDYVDGSVWSLFEEYESLLK